MSDQKQHIAGENYVERPSHTLLAIKPWQALHRIMDEGLGVVLLETRTLSQAECESSPAAQNDFDSQGKGVEVLVLFLSRDDYRAESLSSWCSNALSQDTAWMAILERCDGRLVSGRIHKFEPHKNGVVAHVRLTIYDRVHPPAKDWPESDLAKIVVRYGIDRKTRKSTHSYAKARV